MEEHDQGHHTPTWNEKFAGKAEGFVETIILKSRYLLVPMFCALLFVILTITLDFLRVLIGTSDAAQLTEHTLRALDLMDITMVANLIWLISAGSYYVFVDNGDGEVAAAKKRPRCLTHVSAGVLKEKMAGSLIGVSSVHLLKLFLDISTTKEEVKWQSIGILLAIHIVFIIGLVAFAHTNGLPHHNHKKPEKKHEADHEKARA